MAELGSTEPKKGVSDRVGFLSNAKILFHMTFPILFYELSKRFFSQFFPFVCSVSKVRVEDSYYALACRSPKAVVLDDKRKAILSVRLICIQMTVRDTRCSAISIGK